MDNYKVQINFFTIIKVLNLIRLNLLLGDKDFFCITVEMKTLKHDDSQYQTNRLNVIWHLLVFINFSFENSNGVSIR